MAQRLDRIDAAHAQRGPEASADITSRRTQLIGACGLVVDEACGRERRYHLGTAPLAQLEAWLAALYNRWPRPLDALETEVYRTRRYRRVSTAIPGEKSA